MAPVLKTGVPERVSGVRIPPLPPFTCFISVSSSRIKNRDCLLDLTAGAPPPPPSNSLKTPLGPLGAPDLYRKSIAEPQGKLQISRDREHFGGLPVSKTIVSAWTPGRKPVPRIPRTSGSAVFLAEFFAAGASGCNRLFLVALRSSAIGKLFPLRNTEMQTRRLLR